MARALPSPKRQAREAHSRSQKATARDIHILIKIRGPPPGSEVQALPETTNPLGLQKDPNRETKAGVEGVDRTWEAESFPLISPHPQRMPCRKRGRGGRN